MLQPSQWVLGCTIIAHRPQYMAARSALSLSLVHTELLSENMEIHNILFIVLQQHPQSFEIMIVYVVPPQLYSHLSINICQCPLNAQLSLDLF